MELNTTALGNHGTDPGLRVLGTMSGTSMDALDLVEARFWREGEQWTGRIEALHEVPLEKIWPQRFKALTTGTAAEWFECERDWTRWCAAQILKHVRLKDIDVAVFSGQTIFHQPQNGFTAQLGSGADLYAALGATTPVISDLRSLDVALGGQGAPLVPVVDALLFAEYEACLNLGGFSNISMDSNGMRLAWDVGPCNLVLNRLADRKGAPYDAGGRWAAKGKVLPGLLHDWLALPYHAAPAPKSLGTEWLDTHVWPVLQRYEANGALEVDDVLATATAYIAAVIRLAANGARTLVTGGGAWNDELMRRLRQEEPLAENDVALQAVVPSPEMVGGKEAYAFAFLGMLRWLELENSWPSVTGCSQAHMGGALWGKNGVSSHPRTSMQ
jgi:anhydro-N-acetylmuramic acid kinase